MTFTEYVSFYSLARAEGIVLRYLADAYKALRQTVPEDARTDEVTDLIVWLGELVRQVDSSLLEEWERLRNPEAAEADRDRRRAGRPDATGHGQPAGLPGAGAQCAVPPSRAGRAPELRTSWASWTHASGWSAEAWQDALEPYFAEHAGLQTGAAARGPGLLIIDESPATGRPESASGPSGRSWTTRPVTTTGASPPGSTWPGAMPRASRWSRSSRLVSSGAGERQGPDPGSACRLRFAINRVGRRVIVDRFALVMGIVTAQH